MKDFPIPKGVYEIVDIFCTWVIQLAKPYTQYTINIPGAYLFPFNDLYDLADLEAARELLRVNWGNAITHAQKFGLKMGKWRDPVKPIVKTLNDVDVIAFLNHTHMCYCDDGTDGSQELYPNGGYIGTNLTTNYTGTKFHFKETPNESKIHVLAPWFGTYDGTNNPYGGLILEVAAAGEYGLNIMRVSQHGTNIGGTGFNAECAAKYLCLLTKASIDNAVEDGDYNVVVTGANLTADQGFDDIWVMDLMNLLYYGNNRGATETNNDLLNFFGRLLV
jgi:hypothetical protein